MMLNNNNPLENSKVIYAFAAMVVGMFMSILDIQIVASSLSVIGAGLNATSEELSWVQTSYLIAEVIVIPISGFASKVLSTRILYVSVTAMFTFMSFACSMAWNIESMIFFRSIQGFFGGAMIPATFAVSFEIFPASKRPQISVIMGLVATLAPTLGPLIGGYLSEQLSWHFMFLLNIVPGIIVCLVVYKFGNFDKPDMSLLKNFDYYGVFFLALGLGSFQYILEEGAQKSWFQSNIIVTLTCIFVISSIIFFVIELKHKNPVVFLRAFKNKNFRIGCIFSFVLGFGLLGAVYLVPLYLSHMTPMNSFQIGKVMMVTGVAQFLTAPIAGYLYARGTDHRILLAVGLSLFCTGCIFNSHMNLNWGFEDFIIPQILRGSSLMFCFIPINDIALGSLKKTQIKNSSSIYNLMRNLGGAIGIAILNTNVINGSKEIYGYLSGKILGAKQYTYDNLAQINSYLSNKIYYAKKTSLLLVSTNVKKSAFVISVNESFLIIGGAFFFAICLTIFINKVQIEDNASSH